jgi:ubiquitin carboxyl-terminal hydrolase 36/42
MNKQSFKECMKDFCKTERLEGQNMYKCEKCKKKVPILKKYSVEKAPNVLVITLKRFSARF